MEKAHRQAIKLAKSVGELIHLTRLIDSRGLGGRDYDVIHRALGQFVSEASSRLAYMGNHTLDMLPRYVATRAAIEGVVTAHQVAPFGQYYQVVLEPGGELQKFAPDVILLALSLSQMAPDIASRFVELEESDLRAEAARILDHIGQWVEAARKHTSATLLISNFIRPARSQAGVADQSLAYSEAEFYADLNLSLLRQYRHDNRVRILDVQHAVAGPGLWARTSEKMRYLANIEWGEEWLPAISDEILRHLRAIRGDGRKCLVLDLDNTLWGGIVGEDGAASVKIGDGDAVGEAYRDFQAGILALKARGVVLAICSKNNEADAEEVFRSRKGMRLALDDFTVRRINWKPKHQNIAEIAEKLNIGRDSLVFADDSPVECALIREALPEVRVVHLEGDPAGFANKLAALSDFEKLKLTGEDREKSQQYRLNARRAELRDEVGDLHTFLQTLETQIAIRPAMKTDVARVHQLLTKTNQFNLTTQRYSVSEVENFIASARWQLKLVEVSDKFGNLGVVGLYLLDQLGAELIIDSFILSCRAMGRKVESAMMNGIKQNYLLQGGASALIGRYVPTRKNIPVQAFYDDEGFALVEERESGEKLYRIERKAAALTDCPGMTIIES